MLSIVSAKISNSLQFQSSPLLILYAMIQEEKKDYLEGNSVEPEVVIEKGYIECKYGCVGEHSYAISTENGKILEKGKFTDNFGLDISHLDQGFYQLTIFDAMQRYTVSFYIK